MTTKTKIGWVFLVGLFVAIYVAECTSKREAERASQVTTVWVPFPATGMRRPYFDVEIIDQGKDYIKFRTKDGQVIEQHGAYSTETRRRAPSNQ